MDKVLKKSCKEIGDSILLETINKIRGLCLSSMDYNVAILFTLDYICGRRKEIRLACEEFHAMEQKKEIKK